MPDGNPVKVGEPVPTDGKIHNVGPAPITFLKNDGGTLKQAPTPVKYVIRPMLSSDKAEVKAAFGSLTIADDADHPFARGNSPTLLWIGSPGFRLIIIATPTCPHYSDPIRNPTSSGGIGVGNYEYGIARYRLLEVVGPDGSILYKAPPYIPGIDPQSNQTNTYDSNDTRQNARPGRYKVTVGKVDINSTYTASGASNPDGSNQITEPFCTYGPDVVCEFDVEPPANPSDSVVWYVPGPDVLTTIRQVKGQSATSSSFGYRIGSYPVANSLKIGQAFIGPYSPFTGWADILDVIKVPAVASVRHQASMTFVNAYFVGGAPQFGGTLVQEYYRVDYYASMCGIYNSSGVLITSNPPVIPFDKNNKIG